MLINSKWNYKKNKNKKIRKNILRQKQMKLEYNKLLYKRNDNTVIYNLNFNIDEFISKVKNKNYDNKTIKVEFLYLINFIKEDFDINYYIDDILFCFELLSKNFNYYDKDFEVLKFSFLSNLNKILTIFNYIDYELIITRFLNYKQINTEIFFFLIDFNILYIIDIFENKNNLNRKLFYNLCDFIIIWGYNNLNLIREDETLYLIYLLFINYIIFYNWFDEKWNHIILEIFQKDYLNSFIEELILCTMILLELNDYFFINKIIFKILFEKTIKFGSITVLENYLELYLKKLEKIENNKFILDNEYTEFIKVKTITLFDDNLIIIFIKIIIDLYYQNIFLMDEEMVKFFFEIYKEKSKKYQIEKKTRILQLFITYFDYNIYQYLSKYFKLIQDSLFYDLKNEVKQIFIIKILIFTNLIWKFELEKNELIINKQNLENIKYFINLKNKNDFKDDLIYDYII